MSSDGFYSQPNIDTAKVQETHKKLLADLVVAETEWMDAQAG